MGLGLGIGIEIEIEIEIGLGLGLGSSSSHRLIQVVTKKIITYYCGGAGNILLRWKSLFSKGCKSQLVVQWFSKFKSYSSLSRLSYSHSPKLRNKNFFEKNFFLLVRKKPFLVFVIKGSTVVLPASC